MMKKIITQEGFGILALSTLLIPQIAHTVYVFQTNSQYTNPWFGWCYALGVELAILIFTVKGWKHTALAYLVGTMAHNLVYQFWPTSVVSAILICLMLSATIYSFAHLFYSSKPVSQAHPKAQEIEELEKLRASGVPIILAPYMCPKCGKGYPTSKELNGHISGHKQMKEWDPDEYGDWIEANEQREKVVRELGASWLEVA